METRRQRRLMVATGEITHSVLIKQERQEEDSHPTDLASREVQLDLECLSSMKFEEDVISTSMKTTRKGCPKGTDGEQIPTILIKREVDWLASDSHAPDLANQEATVNMESLRSIKTEENFSYTDGEVREVQQNTLFPQIEEFIITELILDEEFPYNVNDSVANCKQNVIAQDDELDSNSGSSTEANDNPILAPALNVPMVRKHLNKAQLDSQTTNYDSKDCDMKEFLGAACYGQASQDLPTQRRESNPDIKSGTCEVCHGIYPTEYMRAHMRLAHSKPKHKCEFCLRFFKKKCNLKEHLYTHATDRKRQLICDICEKDFYNKSQLRKHKEHYAQRDHPKFHCNGCRFSFAHKGTLQQHMLTKHLDKAQSITAGLQMAYNSISTAQMCIEEQTFECEVCSRSFKTKRLLRRHLKIHSKDRKREFACNSCDSTFYTSDTLRKHQKTHRQDSYHCKVCGKHFAQKENLKVHMRRCQHFDETQQFTPQPSNEAGAPMKTELISDEELVPWHNPNAHKLHFRYGDYDR